LPDTAPSAEVSVRPMTESAWESAEEVSSASSLALACVACSTAEKEASCDRNWVESVWLVGSWFFIWAMRSCRKAL
jgi:hypothetical protein